MNLYVYQNTFIGSPTAFKWASVTPQIVVNAYTLLNFYFVDGNSNYLDYSASSPTVAIGTIGNPLVVMAGVTQITNGFQGVFNLNTSNVQAFMGTLATKQALLQIQMTAASNTETLLVAPVALVNTVNPTPVE